MQTTNSLAFYNASREALFAKESLVPVGDDPDVGCAISVNELAIRVLGHEIGGGTSTYNLLQALIESPLFDEVILPLPGDIIISATGTSILANTPIKNGHTGVVMALPEEDKGICSNNSLNGLWQETYTIASWNNRYHVQGGYPVRFFRAK